MSPETCHCLLRNSLNFLEFRINLLIILPDFFFFLSVNNLSFVSFLILSLSSLVKSYISCSPLFIKFSAFLVANFALLAVLFASFKSIPKFLNLLNSEVSLFINPSLLNFLCFCF